ncbi:hypothetical protein COU60_01220 [Candidatus Pacearchaeota archaeon CG10_big_fil_rev_8_21_14_0_10_34_76]|nr:MAG: hypothetical protein COU60_01220 [Candidatus Pacearchaeota archaeon CG10_big_fil_rev_8_21_14_0_10_34_76]
MDPLKRTFGYEASNELYFVKERVDLDRQRKRLSKNMGVAAGVLVGGLVLGRVMGVYDIYISGEFPNGGIVIEWDQDGKRDFLDKLDKKPFER